MESILDGAVGGIGMFSVGGGKYVRSVRTQLEGQNWGQYLRSTAAPHQHTPTHAR